MTKTILTCTTNVIVPYKILSEETTKLAADFHEEDFISRVMPVKNNVLSAINNNDKKMRKRKRLLFDDISKVHKTYLEKHPEIAMGKSKFFELQLI